MQIQENRSIFKRVAECLYRSHNGRYYALVKRGGKQFKKSLRTTDFALAKRHLIDFREKAVLLAGSSINERKMLFEDLCQLWLASIRPGLKSSSYKRRETAINAGLLPLLKGQLVRCITTKQLETWKIQRGIRLSGQSWNIELETLSMLFRYAQKELRIILENPAETIKRRKAKHRKIYIPTKQQFTLLISALRSKQNNEAADFVEFLGYSGLRLGEASEVHWHDVNFEANNLCVTGGEKGTKNHEPRTIPLFPPLKRLLEEIYNKKQNILNSNRIFSLRSAKKSIASACIHAGLPSFSHHNFRHFFCSNCIEAGVDFKAIAGWLGHKDGGILVAKTYGHLRNEHSEAMALRVTFDVIKEKN